MKKEPKIKQHQASINDAAQNYFTDKAAYGISEACISNYKLTIRRFCNCLPDGELTPIAAITDSDITNFIIALKEAGLQNAISINHYIRDLRAFLYWCMDNNYLQPFKIKKLKEQEVVKETLNEDELQLLLEKPDKKADFNEWRNWAVANYLIGTGNRAGSVVNLQMRDIDIRAKQAILRHTKQGKQQLLPFGDTLAAALKEYIRMWRADAEDEDYLFCNQFCEQLTVNALGKQMRSYMRKRGLTKTGLHIFRHTFAKMYILNGGDVFRLQKLLGHSTLDMTRHYVNIYAADLQKDYEVFSPLDNLAAKNVKKQKIRRA